MVRYEVTLQIEEQYYIDADSPEEAKNKAREIVHNKKGPLNQVGGWIKHSVAKPVT